MACAATQNVRTCHCEGRRLARSNLHFVTRRLPPRVLHCEALVAGVARCGTLPRSARVIDHKAGSWALYRKSDRIPNPNGAQARRQKGAGRRPNGCACSARTDLLSCIDHPSSGLLQSRLTDTRPPRSEPRLGATGPAGSADRPRDGDYERRRRPDDGLCNSRTSQLKSC